MLKRNYILLGSSFLLLGVVPTYSLSNKDDTNLLQNTNLVKNSNSITTKELSTNQKIINSSAKAMTHSDEISIAQLDTIRAQFASCWNVPAKKKAKTIAVDVKLEMNPDATVRSARVINENEHKDPYFQVVAESALRIFDNPKCNPLKLPLDRYEDWKTMTIRFDPSQVL